MKNIDKLTWLVLCVMLISIFCAVYTLPSQTTDRFDTKNFIFIPYTELYIMTASAYTNHPDCINRKWLNGETATGTEAREGIVAINIDLSKDGTSQVNSVLKLGQIIYVRGQFIEGIFRVEDTGYFKVKYKNDGSSKDLTFDQYHLDFYLDGIYKARGFGMQYPIEVYVISEPCPQILK